MPEQLSPSQPCGRAREEDPLARDSNSATNSFPASATVSKDSPTTWSAALSSMRRLIASRLADQGEFPHARPSAGELHPSSPLGWYAFVLPELISSLAAMVGGFSLVVLVAVIDCLIGPDLSVALFYLLPIAALAWRGGYAYGILISLGAAVAWYTVDVLQHSGVAPGIRLWNGAVHLAFFAVAAGLLARLRDALRGERLLARTDALTGAANARIFYESTRSELQRAARTQRPFTVAYFDLDDFKAVNDQLGHSTGDQVLRRVAAVIRQSIRANDILARLGGDEFALLCPETDAAGATAALLRLREALSQEMTTDRWKVTFSLGAATFIEPPADVDTVVHTVDALMYEAKHGGKNRVRHDVVRGGREHPGKGSASERRAGVRFLCGASAHVAVLRDLNDEPSFAVIRDLSKEGIGLYLTGEVARGTLLTVEPLQPSRAKTLLVRIVHCRFEPGGWFHGGELVGYLSEQELKDWLE